MMCSVPLLQDVESRDRRARPAGVQSLNAALGGDAVLGFEFDIRLDAPTASKNAMAAECLTRGRECAGAQQMNAPGACHKRGGAACRACGVSSVGNPSPWFHPTNWTAVFETLQAAGRTVKHVALVRTNSLKWGFAHPAGTQDATKEDQAVPLQHFLDGAAGGWRRVAGLEARRERMLEEACAMSMRFSDGRVHLVAYPRPCRNLVSVRNPIATSTEYQRRAACRLHGISASCRRDAPSRDRHGRPRKPRRYETLQLRRAAETHAILEFLGNPGNVSEARVASLLDAASTQFHKATSDDVLQGRSVESVESALREAGVGPAKCLAAMSASEIRTFDPCSAHWPPDLRKAGVLKCAEAYGTSGPRRVLGM